MRKALLALFLILYFSSLARAQQKWTLSASATSCTTSNTSCLIYQVDASSGGATLTVGANASGNTLQFEATGDGGSTWVALNATPSNGTTPVTSTTSTGVWQTNVAGYTAVRIRMSTLVSGTATVSIITSLASVKSGGGVSGGGTVTSVTGTTNQVTVTNPTTTPVVSLPTTVDLVGGLITGSGDSNLGSYVFPGSSIIDSNNQSSDPDDVVSFIDPLHTEVNMGMFVNALLNRVAVIQTILVGTNGGQVNTFVKPDGGSIFDATHVSPTPPYFFVDSPTNDATVYDTTSAVEISGGAGQNDALTLVGGSAGNATNLNFYLRAISARKAAIQANNSGTNGGGMSIYVKADGGGLTQVNAWNSLLETKFTPTIAAGTQTVSGCSLTSALGGSWTGSFHSGTAGTCTVTITPGGTATNGWQCDATDITTAADTVKQTTPLSTTTCVISGTTASGDIITWKATAF